jgi:Insecticide toxin TcdB middle/C-terminal region/Insecticide toxin TcdB middle/N-terminal region
VATAVIEATSLPAGYKEYVSPDLRIEISRVAGAVATSAANGSGTTLTFTSVPAWVAVGMSVRDATASSVIPANTTVSSKTSTTVVISNAVTGAGVGSGDSIVFSALILDKSLYYDVLTVPGPVPPAASFPALPASDVAVYFKLPRPVAAGLAALDLSDDGSPPNYKALTDAVNAVLNADQQPVPPAVLGKLTSEQAHHIAYEIVWGPQDPLPVPPSNHVPAFWDPIGALYTLEVNDGSTSNQLEQNRQQFEGGLNSYYATHNANVERLTRFIFALSAAVACEDLSTKATSALLDFPVNPGTTGTHITIDTAEVVLVNGAGGGGPLVPAFQVPAEYFYLLGTQLPTQIGADQRFRMACRDNQERLLPILTAGYNDGTISPVPTVNPAQAVRRLTAIPPGSDSIAPHCKLDEVPNINTRDQNLRFVDITGDGFPDILISEDTVFTWYKSRAKEGFAPARRSRKSWDEEKGPNLVFSDPTQSIFLADMVGDGLSDIVRVRYGEVCYWPNLGYGRFGAKVTMGNAPVFESPDLFDPRRIHLADIDGSGNSDIIYVGHDGIALYFNQSGNFWSPPKRLSHFPRVDSLTSIAAMDLLGNGTASLVWSSPLASDARRPLRYIDLMGGQKPHLLVFTTNNMGAETEVQYKASTKFYLQDHQEGRPWVTKLPFPVHVIERVENRDLVSNTKLVSTYRYRHGYYDGVEREFRGFAHVEQRDAESVVGDFDLPPVVTKTWFHNGAFLEEAKLEAYFKDPANQEFFAGDAQASFLPDTDLPPDISFDEMREAARALKGSILRQEVYADDGSAKASLPYSVSERSYKLTCLQPQGPNRHAVFFSHPSETIDYHYERNPADPRISHALTLAVDDYGNVLKSAAIGYRRRVPAFDEQNVSLATLTESQYTNPVLEDDAYRTPLPAEVKTFELTAPNLKGAKPLDFATIDAIAAAAGEIAYEAQPTTGHTQKRLIEQLRTLYRMNDLSALLPLGKVESMALPGESYKLALTPGLLDIFQIKASRAELTAILTGSEGGYRDLDADGRLWIPSGQTFYLPTPGDPAPQELAFAKLHFFLPHRFQDPFGYNTVATYDGKYSLLLIATRDAVGNETFADQDYRVLQPKRIIDPNGNRTEARFDALGMLAGTVVRGKATGPIEGDSFDGFATDLTPTQIKNFFDPTDPRSRAVTHLGTATTRILYDLERVPICAASITRETHVSDLAQGTQTKIQMHFVYSDGFGREAQTKVQAEPGPLDLSVSDSPAANPRWVGTGAKTYNNKGKPVRQYESFFSSKPQFGIEKSGVSSTLFYDPVERVVATLHPNNTFEKVIFDPWQQTTFDVNDTVTFDPRSDPDAGEFFSRLPDADYLPTWFQQRINGAAGPEEKAAAEKAARHANTPTVTQLDTLGRTFLAIADNGKDAKGNDRKYPTRTVLDIEGNQREVVDAIGRVVIRYDYDMLGARIHQASMEASERWMLNDITDKPIRAWNARKYAFRTEYDELRRPLRSFVQGGDPSERNSKVLAQEILFEQTIYGDTPITGLTELQQKQANLRTKVFRHFDGAGTITTDLYDFKGNSLRSVRQFVRNYKNAPDWSQSPTLETEEFPTASSYDALNRAIAITAPDKSIYRPAFNESNLLEMIDVNLRGAQQNGQPVWMPFVTNIDYNARGQRALIQYANGAKTAYEYDDKTFRLTHLETTRTVGQNGLSAQIFSDAATVQDLSYTYDPAGNITRIKDAALKTVFNANQQVDPACDYTYDAIYRVIEATGREHIGQSALPFTPPDGNYRDYPFAGLSQLNNPQALRNYTERYDYDPADNVKTMAHLAGNGAGNWTRAYAYNESSLLEPTRKSNRLSQTALQTNASAPAEPCSYDANGNITQMPHLPLMQWDFKDELCATSRQVANVGAPETTFYVYDAGGERARKITERQNGTLKNVESYREFDAGGNIALLRETLHVMDDKQRIALVETQTVGNGVAIAAPTPTQRNQLTNHVGSVSLELDEAGALMRYVPARRRGHHWQTNGDIL